MYLVFKTTYIDRGKPLREGAFFFTRMRLFPPLDKKNTRDKAKGLLGHFGEAYREAGHSITYLVCIQNNYCSDGKRIRLYI